MRHLEKNIETVAACPRLLTKAEVLALLGVSLHDRFHLDARGPVSPVHRAWAVGRTKHEDRVAGRRGLRLDCFPAQAEAHPHADQAQHSTSAAAARRLAVMRAHPDDLPPDRESCAVRLAPVQARTPRLCLALRSRWKQGQKALFVYPIGLATTTSSTLSSSTPAGPLNGTTRRLLSAGRDVSDHKNAKTENLCEGVALSVECDQRPLKARQTLEDILGPATVVVEGGGEWTNPETGEIEPKVHLHWRLRKPTSTKAEHDLLREARELATKLVGGDATNISIVHPIRWPGSWHRKGTPRLAKIVASSDNEIDLAEAVERLRDASGAATFAGFGFKTNSKLRASDPAAVASALSVIPNDNLAWNDWNRIGMATWAATDGSEVGREAFAKWSAKASKNDPNATESRWQHYKTSPPTKIGFGTLVYLARKHSPGWVYGGAEAKSERLPPRPRNRPRLIPSPSSPTTSTPTCRATRTFSSDRARCGPRAVSIPAFWDVPLLGRTGRKSSDKNGNPKFVRPSRWLDMHRPVEMMTWAPGMPPTIVDRLISEGGWVERKGVTTFNLYRPPSITLGDASKATPWIDLVRKVYPDDAEEIFNFFAHRRQRPDQKINHALLLGGDPGIGKDTMIEPLKQAVGPWNAKKCRRRT